MNKEQHAVTLIGLLTRQQAKELIGLFTYEDKHRFIQHIVNIPMCEKEACAEIVSVCWELIEGTTLPDARLYQEALQQLAMKKPKALARYVHSLIQKTDNYYMG